MKLQIGIRLSSNEEKPFLFIQGNVSITPSSEHGGRFKAYV
jgi:hypothetical protein